MKNLFHKDAYQGAPDLWVVWNKVLKPRGVSSAQREGQNIILQQEHTTWLRFKCDLENIKGEKMLKQKY